MQEMVEEEKVKKAGFPLTIIVGEEVSTTNGEIIGLFLKEKIPAGMTPKETVTAIKEQGGLALLPHGFDPLKRWRLQPAALETVTDEIDVVEAEPLRTAEEAATPNLIVTCHAAFCSPEGMVEMRSTSARIARAAVLGQPVWNRVN